MADENERLKLWLGFAKFFLGTFVIGMLSYTADAVFRDREVTLKELETKAEVESKIIEQEKGYLLDFLPRVTDPNIEQRLRVAQYFASLSRDVGYKTGWKEYLTIVEAEKTAAEKRVKKLEEEAAAKSGEELETARAEIERLKTELELKPQSIELPLGVPAISVSEIEGAAPCESPGKAKLTLIDISRPIRSYSGTLIGRILKQPIERPLRFVRLCENPDSGTLMGDVVIFGKDGGILNKLNIDSWRELESYRSRWSIDVPIFPEIQK